MAIKIDKQHLKAIKVESEQSFPIEGCGFLFGNLANELKIVESISMATNDFEESEKYHRFLITPQAYLKAEKASRHRRQDIIGFFHSHPNANAKPSSYDLEHAWPWYSYLIVSVHAGKAGEITSWVLHENREHFDKEEIL